ncbi:ankyrin [Aspergillus sclerotioniger CBS 115572]|uniref:Ankyrin n=1 Tax=Aspergillus sclerotioniger CBS 115572 TaxID=1450535 RepID=A0A317XBU6_9EURO|nr:ankyrin [Aspergillus sclerotioniger CBS 115572]PWY96056.1 ankyrin [Aspergillus sclerotioniger CBS 115572]
MGDQSTFNNTDHTTTHNQAGHQVVNGDGSGASIQDKDKSHLDRKLLDAAKAGETEKVQQLLDEGANASATDAQGQTVLHIAASEGLTDIVSLLLKRGAKKDVRDNSDRQPAHLARLFGHVPLANKLELNLL